jgi:hypothetical protein
MAGVLAQTPNPASFPYPSQIHARPAGTAFLTASNGRHLIPITLSPGLVGANRVIAGVDQTDANDLPVPVAGVTSLEVTASCPCAASPVRATLQRVAGGPWFAAEVTLGAQGHWTVEARPQVAGVAEEVGTVTADVEPLAMANQVLVGVAADLSGDAGKGCQDRAIGLQAAAIEANQAAVAGGDIIRTIALDTRELGGRGAVARLVGMHVAMLAMPCGDPATVGDVAAAAGELHLPVVGARGLTDPQPWVWTTGLDAESEGAALADQAAARKSQSALLLAGATARDQREGQAASRRLDGLGIPHRQLSIGGEGAPVLAARVRELNPGTVILVATPSVALPVIQAFGALQPEWSPATGALASTDLMSNSLVSAAGRWTLAGRISFASEVDPDDAPSLEYVTRLQEWFGGRRPAFDGVYGYIAGWIVNNALRDVGEDRSPARLRTAFDTRFRDFTFGSSYRLSWSGGRGGADQLAFFTTVYTNPLTLLGAPASTNHAGIFLRSGAYVRLSPYTHLES